MSDIDDFETEIIQEAEEKAIKIILNAKSEAKKILDQTASEKARSKRKIDEDKQKEAERFIQREISKMKIQNNIELNTIKQEVIQDVLTSSLQKIQLLRKKKDKEYSQAIQNQIKRAAILLEGGELLLEISSDDIKQIDISGIEKVVSDELKKPTTISIVKNPDSVLNGGFILKKGQLEIENTIQAILERRAEYIRNELHQILFKTD